MARIFTDGAEFGDVLLFTSAPSTAASTVQKRSGAYSYLVTGSGYINLAGYSEVYLRIAVWNAGNMLSNGIAFRNGTTTLGSIGRNATSKFVEIRIGTTLSATGTIPLLSSTWYVLEWHLKIDNSAGISEVKVDGVADATTGSTDTQPGAETTFDNLYLSSNAGSASTYFDDLALNDTSGGVDDSWCGDGKIILLTPNANGDSSDLVGSDSDSTNNYLLVDDIPADSDTTYVQSATPDDYDLYNLVACGLSGVTISRVWAEARAKDLVAEGGQIKLTVKTEATEYDSSAIDLLTTYTIQIGRAHV